MTDRNPELTAYRQGLHEAAITERARVVAHIREAAGRIIGEVMRAPDVYDLKTAEIAATAMEETAAAIETGDHWRDFA